MISFKEQEALFQIISAKQQILERYADKFYKTFGTDTLAIFRACYALNNFLLLNLLTKTQRLIAIFLLIDCFKSEGIKKNPFAQTLIDICDKPLQEFETKLICQILFENKRDKYSKIKIEALLEQQQLYNESYKPRDQFEKFKKQYRDTVPRNFTSVRNIIPDVSEKKNIVIPEILFNRDSIKEEQLGCDNFSANFLRPTPNFIQINSNQLIWVSPGIITDVMWDSTIQKQRCLMRIKFLLKKVQKQNFSIEQLKQIIKILDDYPYLIYTIDLPSNNFIEIALKNPFLATEIFSRLNKSSVKIQEYSQKLISGKLTYNSIETMSRILSRCQLHEIFIKCYIIQTIKKCNEMQSIDNDKFSKLISKILKFIFKNNLINIKDKQILEEVKRFVKTYPKTSEDNLIQYLNENQ